MIAVGSPRGGSQGGGSVVAYNYYDGSDGLLTPGWYQRGSALESPLTREALGYSVSLHETGLTMLVGSPQASSIDSIDAGKATQYIMDGTEWQPSGFEAYGEAEGSDDGTSVAMSRDGTVVVIGGKNRNEVNAAGDVSLESTGYCRVYSFEDGLWVLQHTMVGQTAMERLGSSVAVSPDGNVVACGGVDGAIDVGSSSTSGVVRLLNRETLQESAIWPRGEAANVEGATFGTHVALSEDGGYVVVGAPTWSGTVGGASSGAIQVFRSVEV